MDDVLVLLSASTTYGGAFLLDQRRRPVGGVHLARDQPGAGRHERGGRRFVRDRRAGTTSRVSVSSTGAQADNHSLSSSISANGRRIAFVSDASNLVPGDTNGVTDVFLRDMHGHGDD
jgi:hypothetical protein